MGFARGSFSLFFESMIQMGMWKVGGHVEISDVTQESGRINRLDEKKIRIQLFSFDWNRGLKAK